MVDAMEMDNRSKDALSDYYYFKVKDIEGTEVLSRFYVERDDCPFHPWKDFDGFLTTINVWWNRYSLGHNEGKGDPDEMLRELVEKYVDKELIKKKALAGDFAYKYEEWAEVEEEFPYKVTYQWCGQEHEYFLGVDDDLMEDIYSSLQRNEMMVLLQTHATESMILIPVYIYEHSGITISTGSFGDPWDSGMAGFAYIEKKKYEDMTLRAWDTKDAREIIKDEVHMYDQYLQGDVYMYCEEEYDPASDSFDSSENCGGFYSDLWGEELAMYLINDLYKEPQIISEEEAEEFIKEAQIMEQANLGIAI